MGITKYNPKTKTKKLIFDSHTWATQLSEISDITYLCKLYLIFFFLS